MILHIFGENLRTWTLSFINEPKFKMDGRTGGSARTALDSRAARRGVFYIILLDEIFDLVAFCHIFQNFIESFRILYNISEYSRIYPHLTEY